MTSKTTKRVGSFFDGYANDFNAIYGDGVGGQRSLFNKFCDKFFRQAMSLRFDYVIQNIDRFRPERILDLGCGGGIYLQALINAGISFDAYTGVDVADGMLALCEKRIEKAGCQAKVNFVKGDVLDKSVLTPCDMVFAMGLFDYLENPQTLIDNIKAVKPCHFLFSAPKRDHWLVPQRSLRYRMRNCDLFFYTVPMLENLLDGLDYHIEDLGRDFMVHVKF